MKFLVHPLFMITCLLFATSCSSTKKAEVAAEVKPIERVAKPDFEVVEFSDAAVPVWIKSPDQVDKSEDRKKNRYFVNEATHTDQRLCLRSAEARATARIASEIAQFVKNTYAEATQGGGDEEVSEYMQEQLAQDAQSFLVGVQVAKTYWEKRKYKETLGAEEDMTKFYCYAVVKMDKKHVKKAVSQAMAKLYGEIEAPEVKTKTNAILKDVDQKFADLDKPVEVKKEEEE